jgi:hypothetical protein
MNIPQNPGVGGFLGMKPIWHPPVDASWIFTVVLLVIAANADEIAPKYRSLLLHPFAFFAIIVFSLVLYDYGYMHVTFAILFFILGVWAISRKEGFSPSGTLDWVTYHKRWFSEIVLKEKPVAIQEKDVATFPIQGG